MTRREMEELIYGKPEQQRRFTQDFPILPDVWIAYAELQEKRKEAANKDFEPPSERIELLLTPHTRSDAATLARVLRDRLSHEEPAIDKYRQVHLRKDPNDRPKQPRILFNEAVVFADFTFEELMRVAMPLTDWWKSNVVMPLRESLKSNMDASTDATDVCSRESIRNFVARIQEEKTAIQKGATKKKLGGDPRLLDKLITVVEAIECDRREKTYAKIGAEEQSIALQYGEAFADLLEGLTRPDEKRGLLYGISRNRPANTSIWRSRMAVKADAAGRVFEVDTSGICWAVLDVGIDATHDAFARRKNGEKQTEDELDENGQAQFASRVVRTYDFLRIKELLDPNTDVPWMGSYVQTIDQTVQKRFIEDVKHNLDFGRAIDWDLLEPFLRIPHVHGLYESYKERAKDSHGSHVAGIIAANWPEAKDTSLEKELYGICPDLEIYDLRVLGLDSQGNPADEFTIIAALQFVRHLNAHRDLMAIHGVNLSMAVTHDVANYACGRTRRWRHGRLPLHQHYRSRQCG